MGDLWLSAELRSPKRPPGSFLSEVRLGLDARLRAPIELAPLIDPNVHSCGTVYPPGHRELSHPEDGSTWSA